LLSIKVTVIFPSSPFYISLIAVYFLNLVPFSAISLSILSTKSLSKPLSNIDLTATSTSHPIPFKNPPHSSATYPAPTTKVFPGLFSNQNRSSEVIVKSLCFSSNLGLPPAAIKTLSAVTVSTLPLASVSYIV